MTRMNAFPCQCSVEGITCTEKLKLQIQRQERTWSVWSDIVCAQVLVCRSQSLTFESLDPVAKHDPLG